MLMSPSNGGGSTGVKRPTGEAHPTVSSSGNDGNGGGDGKDPKERRYEPMEVVFTSQTFRKLIAWTFGPLLVVLVAGLGGFFYFYHQVNNHMGDPTIHLTRGERDSLENKGEAVKARKQLKEEIITHFDVKVREIKVEQKEQVNKLGEELKKDQTSQLTKILVEVKKARQDIKSQ
jgi:hypothetical protein